MENIRICIQFILLVIGCARIASSVDSIIKGHIIDGVFVLCLSIFIVVFNTIQLLR